MSDVLFVKADEAAMRKALNLPIVKRPVPQQTTIPQGYERVCVHCWHSKPNSNEGTYCCHCAETRTVMPMPARAVGIFP